MRFAEHNDFEPLGRSVQSDMNDHGQTRRRTLQAAGVALATALAGCSGGDDGDDGGSTDADETVTVGPGGNNVFDPETVEISVGETIAWEWDSANHTVTPDSIPDGAEWAGEPEVFNSGHTYTHTFETTGTYEYYCEPHRAAGMEGSVVVSGSGDE